MKNDKRADYVTRDGVLKMLSDDEVAKVSDAETATQLIDGDEYLDLEHLALGVRRADGITAVMGSVLPKKAVQESTWGKILALLQPTSHRNGAL